MKILFHCVKRLIKNLARAMGVIEYTRSLAIMPQKQILPSANLCPRRLRHQPSTSGAWISDLNRRAQKSISDSFIRAFESHVVIIYRSTNLATLAVPTN